MPVAAGLELSWQNVNFVVTKVATNTNHLLSTSAWNYSIAQLECLAVLPVAVLPVLPPSLSRRESSRTMLAFFFKGPHRLALLVGFWVSRNTPFLCWYKSGHLHQDAGYLSCGHVDPPDISGHDCNTCVLNFSNLIHGKSTLPQCFARSSHRLPEFPITRYLATRLHRWWHNMPSNLPSWLSSIVLVVPEHVFDGARSVLWHAHGGPSMVTCTYDRVWHRLFFPELHHYA